MERPIAAALVLALSALFSGPAAGHSTLDEIRRELTHRLTADELDRLEIPFEADGEIRSLAGEITRDAHGERQKLSRLLRYFRKQGYLNRYQKTGTYTAREVLDKGEGNCLSYANLFVAMARSVGLQAVFLDASVVAGEFGRSGSVLVDYGHIMVGVRMGAELSAIDFDGRLRSFNRYDVISDIQAVAEYYNNLGYEQSWILRARGGFASSEVLDTFRMATRVSPGFARAWNNLGVALKRSGRIEEAVEAYRRAIQENQRMPGPHANLGQIFLRRGELAEALEEFKTAVTLHPDNGYYRYFLGKVLALSGQLKDALAELERGVNLDENIYQAHMQMAFIYLQMGSAKQAASAARRVLEIVPGHRDARRLLECLRNNKRPERCG